MTILYRDPLFQTHDTGKHPESPLRLAAIDAELKRTGLAERCQTGRLRSATQEELVRLHPASYLEWLQAKCAEVPAGDVARIEADTAVCSKSWEVARTAAGTALAAVDAVLNGDDTSAFCLIRPPGHHALARKPMGFCLLANVALAAQHAITAHRLSRVLIVDWDVHHGNGTQDLFYDREDVVFYSAHRFPFYPGTGSDAETGTGRGLGATFNLPIKFGTAREEYLARFSRMLEAAARRCRPQLVLISAGFDAHRLDPVGSLGLEVEDFATLTRQVQEVAHSYCGGRLVSLLEGGYHLEATAESAAIHLQTLLGD